MMEFQFASVAEWWAMAGHGPYVWFCYALAFAMVLANWIWLRRARRLFLRNAQARLQRKLNRTSQTIPSEPLSGNS